MAHYFLLVNIQVYNLCHKRKYIDASNVGTRPMYMRDEDSWDNKLRTCHAQTARESFCLWWVVSSGMPPQASIPSWADSV